MAKMINGPDALLPQVISNADEVLESIQNGYSEDNLFSKIQDQPSHFLNFCWEKSLLYFYHEGSLPVLCIPQLLHWNRRLTEIILSQAHETLGHAGTERMLKYIQQSYWWSTLSKDVEKFC